MTVSETIKKRRAIYPAQYNDGNISENDLKEILENANYAPTHRLTQPWFFKIYQNEYRLELANSMANHYNSLNPAKNINFKEKKIIDKCTRSSCIIAIFMNRDLSESVPEWEEIASTAMAVQNMWLTCTEKNIGCYWSTPNYIKNMNEYFNLNDNQKCLGFFFMGSFNHSDKKPSERNNILNKTEWFK